MKLLTKELKEKIPKLYAQEDKDDPVVYAKFFTPDSNWTWYVLEYDGEDTLFCYVEGFENELGYVSLSELKNSRGPMALAIERDRWFTEKPLSEVKGG